MKTALTLTLFLSGCCCSFPSSDTDEWNAAVKREKSNPQIYALEAGTANVWELEVAYPDSWSQEDEDASAERAAQREERRLQDLLKPHGVDVGELRELPPPTPKRGLRPAYRVRFVTLFPEPSPLSSEGLPGGDCASCAGAASQRGVPFVRSFGAVPIDLRTVTREQLQAGVKVIERASFQSLAESVTTSVGVPPEGEVQVRLVESCSAKLVRIQQSITVGTGSGVIAVPKNEERTWYEVRDATCAGRGGSSRTELGPTFKSGESSPPSARNVMLLRAQAERLGLR